MYYKLRYLILCLFCYGCIVIHPYTAHASVLSRLSESIHDWWGQRDTKPITPQVTTKPPVDNPSVLDNTKYDWWLVRDKNHETPRVNDTLKFDYATYDAYYVGTTKEKVIYLTFDEGYEEGYTPAILDALKNTDVKAIFFVTTPYITYNPDIIKRMVDEGHLVANHTRSHPSMPTYAEDVEKFNHQLLDVENHFRDITGTELAKFFRPPMGHYSERSLAMTQALGYKTLFWSFAYLDFDIKNQPSHEKAKKIMLDNLHNGSVMLLHAVSKTNAEVLEDFIKEAQNMGYTFKLFE